LEDLRRAIAAGEVDLVRPGAVGLRVEVDEELDIERVAPVGTRSPSSGGGGSLLGEIKY